MNTGARHFVACILALCVSGFSASSVGAAAPAPTIATDGYVRVVDDTGVVSFEVPAAWSSLFTAAVPNDAFGPIPSVVAQLPGGQFPTDLISPGALYSAFPADVVVADLAAVAGPTGCAGPTSEPYTNGSMTGVVDRYVGCDAAGSQVVIFAGAPADGSFVGLLIIHPGLAADPSIVPNVLASMNQPATAPVPAPVPTPAPVPSPAPVPTPSDNGVVVTGVGDMSTSVNLFVPYVIGQRGNSENYATYSATLTASGSQSWTTGFQVEQHEIGLDEVIAADPNGSITLRYTPSEISLSQTYTNPDLSAPVDNVSVLEGLAQIITYGPDRFSTSVVTEPGANPTPAQQSLLADLEYSMPGASFPTAPIGMGGSWTAPVPLSYGGFSTTAPANYQLVSVTGDQYLISVSVTLDVATIPASEYIDGATAVVGAITMTETLTGSLTNPMIFHEQQTTQVHVTTTYSDGLTLVEDGVVNHAFEETVA